MSLILKSGAYALRACELLRRAGRQTRAAKGHRARFYRDAWRQAAAEIGATVQALEGDLLRIARDGVETHVFRNYTELDGPATLRAVGDKPYAHRTLRACGLPTPEFTAFSLNDLTPAFEFLRRHGVCVVKPAMGTGAGEGVTTGIETRRQLVAAAVAAAGYGPQLLIEQQMAGDNLRLLYLDGELLDAVHRRPPTAVGDGRSSIRDLIARLNKQRLANGYAVAQVTLRRDQDLRRTLARQRLSLRSVPAAGQAVILKTVINDNAAEDNVSVLERISDDLTAAGRRAAEALGVRLAGVDILTPDMTTSLAVRGVVLEVNTTPGFYIHYAKHDGPCRVAIPILEACLAHARERAVRQHSVSLC